MPLSSCGGAAVPNISTRPIKYDYYTAVFRQFYKHYWLRCNITAFQVKCVEAVVCCDCRPLFIWRLTALSVSEMVSCFNRLNFDCVTAWWFAAMTSCLFCGPYKTQHCTLWAEPTSLNCCPFYSYSFHYALNSRRVPISLHAV